MADYGAAGHQPASAADGGQFSPQESLALISEQRAGAFRSLSPNPVPILGSWGVAWLFGFGACYLASGRGSAAVLPGWAAWATLSGLSVAAMAITARQLRRSGRGVAGPSRTVAAMYGWSWALGCGGAYALNLGLASQGMPVRLLPLLWPASTLLVVGVLYLAGGVIWQDRLTYGLGAWTLLVAGVSVAAGPPANFAVLALAGGGGLLAAAAAAQRPHWWRVPR
ncbi:MAG: hypothetical protein ACM32E_05110 [Gemmatimonadota bacterium]